VERGGKKSTKIFKRRGFPYRAQIGGKKTEGKSKHSMPLFPDQGESSPSEHVFSKQKRNTHTASPGGEHYRQGKLTLSCCPFGEEEIPIYPEKDAKKNAPQKISRNSANGKLGGSFSTDLKKERAYQEKKC